MSMRILFPIIVPLLILGACSDDDPVVVPSNDLENEEYAVWSATLDSMAVWEKDDILVLCSETTGYPITDSATAAYLRGQLKVPDDALQDYETRNARKATIERKLVIDAEYVLLTGQQIEGILAAGGYDELYRLYPDCTGVTTLSRVGFNSTRTSAVVYLSATPGILAGVGWAVFLRKLGGKWQVQTSAIVWVS